MDTTAGSAGDGPAAGSAGDGPAAGSAGDGPAAGSPPDIDWSALQDRATELMRLAYAPYSNYPVGVAGLVDDGRVVAGCNVENAALGVTLCAECGMVSELVATGGGRLVAVACVNRLGDLIMPCGRCRQLIWEHGGGTCLLATPQGVLPMTEVLPQAFGPEDLDRV